MAFETVCVVPKDSADVIVVFSARGVDKGKFTFWKLLAEFPATLIFVNDHSHGWYLRGTPEFATEAAMLSHLQQLIAKHKGSGGRLFTLGTSMGAYAALKYGSAFSADAVLAFGPESEVCIPLGRSVTSLSGYYKEGDEPIFSLTYKNGAEVTIISGNEDIVDLYCAARFYEGNPQIRIVIVNNCDHLVTLHLHREIGLDRFLLNYFYPSPEGNLQSNLHKLDLGQGLGVESARILKLFNEGLARKETLLQYKAEVEKLALANPNWAFIQYSSGMCRFACADYRAAATFFNQCLSSRPRLARARVKLIHCYFKTMRLAEAERELDVLLEQTNSYAASDLGCKILFKLGKHAKLASILENAISTVRLKKRQRQHLYANLMQTQNGGNYISMTDAISIKVQMRATIARALKPLRRFLGMVRGNKPGTN